MWGLQPTIANFRDTQLKDRPDEVVYMVRLAKLRARATDYLLYGTFLRPPELRVSNVTLDLSRVSIYVARRGGPTTSQGDYPAAIAAAWRAPNGNVAIAVASIAGVTIRTITVRRLWARMGVFSLIHYARPVVGQSGAARSAGRYGRCGVIG